MRTSKITKAVAEKVAEKHKKKNKETAPVRTISNSSLHTGWNLDFAACAVAVGDTVATTNSLGTTAIGASGFRSVDSILDTVIEARLLGGDNSQLLLTASLDAFTTLFLNRILALESLGLEVRNSPTLVGVCQAVTFQSNQMRVRNAHVSRLQDLAGIGTLSDPGDGVGVLDDLFGEIGGV